MDDLQKRSEELQMESEMLADFLQRNSEAPGESEDNRQRPAGRAPTTGVETLHDSTGQQLRTRSRRRLKNHEDGQRNCLLLF